jgi:hypothetical protein
MDPFNQDVTGKCVQPPCCIEYGRYVNLSSFPPSSHGLPAKMQVMPTLVSLATFIL